MSLSPGQTLSGQGLPSQPFPGQPLPSGQFTFQSLYRQEGFGHTYTALHTSSNTTVLLQTLDESLHTHPGWDALKQRFRKEAQALSHCRHPGLSRVLDYFEESGHPYVVMELPLGPTLAQLRSTQPPPSESQVLMDLRQSVEALQVLHQGGVLHRNLTPHQLRRIPEQSQWVITGFGLAHEGPSGSPPLLPKRLSDGYAALEQYLTGSPATPATDIYGLAATLYFWATGQPPIAAPLGDRLPQPSIQRLRPDFRPEIGQAIEHGMALEAAQRPPTLDSWLFLFAAYSPQRPRLPKFEPPSSPTPSSQTLSSSAPSSPPSSPPAPPSPTPSSSSVSGSLVATPTPSSTEFPTPSSTDSSLPSASAPRLSPQRPFLCTLGFMGAIALLIGIGIGCLLRFYPATNSGGSLFQQDQSFPEKAGWPIQVPLPSPSPEPPPDNSPENSPDSPPNF